MVETEQLKQIPLFQGLSKEELGEISRITELRSVTTGEILFTSGDPRKFFLIVLSGQVHVFRTFNNEVQTLAYLDVNDFAVESALVDPSEHHEHSGEVVSDGELLIIDGKHFLNFAKKNPSTANEIYGRVIANLSERLHHANNKLVTIFSTGKIASTYETLDNLTDLLLRTILTVIRAKRALFVLFRPLEGKAIIRDAMGFKNDQAMRNMEISLASDPILGIVYKTKKDVIIGKEQFDAEPGLHTPYASSTMLVTPLYLRERVVGAIVLGEKRSGKGFSHNNQILLNIIGRQVVAAVLAAEEEETRPAAGRS